MVVRQQEVLFVPLKAVAAALDQHSASPTDAIAAELAFELKPKGQSIIFVVVNLSTRAVEQVGAVGAFHKTALAGSPTVSDEYDVPQPMPSASGGTTINAWVDAAPPGYASIGVWTFEMTGALAMAAPTAAMRFRIVDENIDIYAATYCNQKRKGGAYRCETDPSRSGPDLKSWTDTGSAWTGGQSVSLKDLAVGSALEVDAIFDDGADPGQGRDFTCNATMLLIADGDPGSVLFADARERLRVATAKKLADEKAAKKAAAEKASSDKVKKRQQLHAAADAAWMDDPDKVGTKLADALAAMDPVDAFTYIVAVWHQPPDTSGASATMRYAAAWAVARRSVPVSAIHKIGVQACATASDATAREYLASLLDNMVWPGNANVKVQAAVVAEVAAARIQAEGSDETIAAVAMMSDADFTGWVDTMKPSDTDVAKAKAERTRVANRRTLVWDYKNPGTKGNELITLQHDLKSVVGVGPWNEIGAYAAAVVN